MLKGIKKNCLIQKRKKDPNSLMIKLASSEPRFKKVEIRVKDFRNNLKKKEQKENSYSKA